MEILRAERTRDRRAVLDLLRAVDLPVAGVDEHFAHFLVAVESGVLVGVVGLEVYTHRGLLRSLAVQPACQRAGIGAALVAKVLELASSVGISDLYLLTTTAAEYFQRFGFHPMPRRAVPEEVRASKEFSEVRCASAVTMHRALSVVR